MQETFACRECCMPGILRPPAHGATLKRVDISGAKQMVGVLVVEEGDLIAVLHEHPDTAWKALAKIRAEFEPSKSKLDDKNIFDHLLQVSPCRNRCERRRKPRHGEEPRR